MGLGRALLLGDLGLCMDISDVAKSVDSLRGNIADGWKRDVSLRKATERLFEENARLKLYFVAIVRLLTAKGVITNEELRQIVEAVDAEDGCVDGKYTGKSIYPQPD